MTPGRATQPILYRQLTLRLSIPLLVIVAVVGAMGLFSVGAETSAVFDRWLLDAAVSLADQVRSTGSAGANAVDLPEAARTMLAYDEIDHTWFSVEDRGRVLVGSANIPASGVNAAAYPEGRAYDAVYEGAPVRVAAVKAPCGGCDHVTVLVAETTLKRQRSSRVVQWLLMPLALMLMVTCSAIYIAVRRTTRPLESLAEQWNRQAHASLQPIPEGDLPSELSPFATALNDLLSRIRGILVRERMFAAAAAHQLRTPLTALRLGMARARNSPDLESARAVLDELAQVTEHTGRLVQQLMLLGRLDPEGRGDLDRTPADLRDIARDVCGLFAEAALDQHVDLELQMPSTRVTVTAQVELLAEALANLIDNAMKAVGRKGRVLVAVIESPPGLRICDNGPGIKPSERRVIFERYARGSRPRWQGTGLGLAIVHDIAAMHGATVSVSDGELGGACFAIEFPAAGA
ncbi:MAG: sensor histidine kinase N-terminal domain-containing protein [Burkholderiaceae bacterium]